MDQILALRMVIEKMLAKERKCMAAFMDLEKSFDKVEWTMWDVLKVYVVGGRLLEGVKVFYKNAEACVKVGGKVSENFGI